MPLVLPQILRDETSSPSKKDRIKSILQKFNTNEINLSINCNGSTFHNGVATVNCTIENCLFIHFGEMKGIQHLHDYLEQRTDDGDFLFLYTISPTKTNFITASEKSLGLHCLPHKDTHETPLVFSASFLYTMMLGSKGLLPPTDAYELLRCEAAPAILQTFEIR